MVPTSCSRQRWAPKQQQQHLPCRRWSSSTVLNIHDVFCFIHAWDTWNVYPEVTAAFEGLTKMHGHLTEKAQSQIERFVILVYDRTSDVLEINKARKELFTKKSRSLENLPPTQAALHKQFNPRTGQRPYVWKVSSVTCRRSVVSSGYSGFLHQKTDFITISPPWYDPGCCWGVNPQ